MSAALIARLIEAGTPAALVADVAMELGRAAAAADILEQRRAKDRIRKRPRISEDSTESVETVEPPPPQSPPLKVSPDPFKNTPSLTPQPTPKRARRLPDDWQPQPLTGKAGEMVAAWQAGEMERELAKFRNYWLAKGGADAAKTNWQRTWINWLISADERKPRNARTNGMGRHQPNDGLSATSRAALAVFGASHERPVPQ